MYDEYDDGYAAWRHVCVPKLHWGLSGDRRAGPIAMQPHTYGPGREDTLDGVGGRAGRRVAPQPRGHLETAPGFLHD